MKTCVGRLHTPARRGPIGCYRRGINHKPKSGDLSHVDFTLNETANFFYGMTQSVYLFVTMTGHMIELVRSPDQQVDYRLSRVLWHP